MTVVNNSVLYFENRKPEIRVTHRNDKYLGDDYPKHSDLIITHSIYVAKTSHVPHKYVQMYEFFLKNGNITLFSS